MNTAAGVIEGVGNLAAVCVAAVWARVAWRARIRTGSALLVHIAMWAATNVFYAAAYVLRQHGTELWDTPAEDTVKFVQQYTQLVVPVLGMILLKVFAKDRRALAR